ncbi:MAG: hypothetical protein QM734_03150 [Cyclobacteriaceae bacterium]
MIWCSGWRLASAVSNAGGLGLIGSGSSASGNPSSSISKNVKRDSEFFWRECATSLSGD